MKPNILCAGKETCTLGLHIIGGVRVLHETKPKCQQGCWVYEQLTVEAER